MIHLQAPVNDWLQAVQRLPAGSVIKAVDNVQALDEAKRTNPGIKTCLRHWYDHGQVFGGSLSDNMNRARLFLATFVDGTFVQYAASVDYIEEWNEYLANSHTGTELAQRVMWAEAVANVWKNEYRNLPQFAHIRLVLCNTAIGNNIDRQFAEIADHYDCVMGYHAYTQYRQGVRDPGDWQYLSGRWATMDADYRAHGFVVDWLFTEAGPFESVETGWRHERCLGGNVGAYVDAVRAWINDCKGTHAYRNGRTKGFCLFTTGGGAQWQYYETRQPELNLLADMVRAEWKPGTTLPPPPPPEPHTWRKHVILASQRTTPDQYDYLREVAYPTKTEIAFSADSAFARPSNVTGHSVDVYDADGWGGRPALEAWVAQHYSYNPPTDVRWYDYPPASGFRLTHWPSISRYITQAFGANPEIYQQYGLPGHDGVDIAAPQDTVIKAAAAGKVIRADFSDAYGYHVRLEHEGGEYHTIYGHLAPDLNVTVNQDIPGGYKLGYSGNTGNSTGFHLHFGMKRFPVGMAGWPYNLIDPTPYLNQL